MPAPQGAECSHTGVCVKPRNTGRPHLDVHARTHARSRRSHMLTRLLLLPSGDTCLTTPLGHGFSQSAHHAPRALGSQTSLGEPYVRTRAATFMPCIVAVTWHLDDKHHDLPGAGPLPTGTPVGLLRGAERKSHRYVCSGGRQVSLHLLLHPGQAHILHETPCWGRHGVRWTQRSGAGGAARPCCGRPSGQAKGVTGQCPQSRRWEDCHAPPSSTPAGRVAGGLGAW